MPPRPPALRACRGATEKLARRRLPSGSPPHADGPAAPRPPSKPNHSRLPSPSPTLTRRWRSPLRWRHPAPPPSLLPPSAPPPSLLLPPVADPSGGKAAAPPPRARPPPARAPGGGADVARLPRPSGRFRVSDSDGGGRPRGGSPHRVGGTGWNGKERGRPPPLPSPSPPPPPPPALAPPPGPQPMPPMRPPLPPLSMPPMAVIARSCPKSVPAEQRTRRQPEGLAHSLSCKLINYSLIFTKISLDDGGGRSLTFYLNERDWSPKWPRYRAMIWKED